MTDVKQPPYKDKEFEDLLPHVLKGLTYMRSLPRDDKSYHNYLLRFYNMLEYFLSTLEPVPEMRIMIDRRMSRDYGEKPGDIVWEKGNSYRVTGRGRELMLNQLPEQKELLKDKSNKELVDSPTETEKKDDSIK